MLQREHSAIVSTFIKLPFVIKTFVLSIFEWPFYTGFTVYIYIYIYIYIYYKAGNVILDLIASVTSEGSHEPVHLCRLIRAFSAHAYSVLELDRQLDTSLF